MKLRVLRKRQSRVTRPFQHISSLGRVARARLMQAGQIGYVEGFRLVIGMAQ